MDELTVNDYNDEMEEIMKTSEEREKDEQRMKTLMANAPKIKVVEYTYDFDKNELVKTE